MSSSENTAVSGFEGPLPAPPGAGGRILYLDNLKAFLIALVVLHHFGMAFTNQVWWIYHSKIQSVTAGRLLDFGDAFAMGLFFFVSGYLFPPAYDRNGPRRFLMSRVVRLGLVFLLALFTVNLLVMYLHHTIVRDFPPVSLWTYFTDFFMGGAPGSWTASYIGPNPPPPKWPGPYWPDYLPLHLWFIQNLLIYAFFYFLLRETVGRFIRLGPSGRPGAALRPVAVHAGAVLFILFVAGTSYWVRLHYPIDKYVDVLHHIMIEWAHAPAYLSMVALGVVAYRRDWLSRLPQGVAWVWLAIGAAALAANLFGLVYQDIPGAPHKGGANAQSLVYATWEAIVGVGWAFGFLAVFRRFADRDGPVWRFASAHCYAVYLVHLPLVFAISYAIDSLGVSSHIYFYVGAFVTSVLCFVLVGFVGAVARSITRIGRRRRETAAAS